MKRILILLFSFLCIQAFAQVPPEILATQIDLDPQVRTGKLPNGLRYYVLKNSKPEKRMELRLAVNTGSTQETDNQLGIAHLVEHMAFNGTKHFKKNDLVDYLESVGTKFGPHLNAYTSFDETVYMMQVPTDSQEIFMKAFLILEDWAGGLTFDPKEIDKERGVVIEEWRLGQGAFERMRNQYWPKLFEGSRYEHRLPIGKKEILEKVPYDTIISFYKDWYRPDNMAVIAVGDFDPDAVVNIIKVNFSRLKNPSKEKKVQRWPLIEHPHLNATVAKDKEAPYTTIQFIYVMPPDSLRTENDFRNKIKYALYNGMMQARLDEITNKSNAPFTNAGTSYGSLVRTASAYNCFAVVRDKGVIAGINGLIDENERAKRFGFFPTELERQKKQSLRLMQRRMNEAGKTESARFASGLVGNFLRADAYPGIPKEMELYMKYLDGITTEEINEIPRKWASDRGQSCCVIIQAPEKSGLTLPEEPEVRKLFESTKRDKLEQYMDFPPLEKLMTQKPLAGKVISSKHNDEFDYTELTLSNGAKLVYKKTDFKNDEIQFRAMSWGGSSLYPVADDQTVAEAPGIIQKSGLGEYDRSIIDKTLKGKIVFIRPGIGDFSESIYGSTSPQDFDLFMQLVYLQFTAPRMDTGAFNSYMDQQRSFVENRKLDPGNTFSDTVETTLSGYNARRKPTTLALLKGVKAERALEIYKERFANAGDFTFFLIGNLNDDEVKQYAAQYVASLPSNGVPETWQDIGIERPKGIINKVITAGIEPKSTVGMYFTGDAIYSSKENMDMKVLTKLMSIKLREVLREEKSGTYGVSCNGYINRIPKQEFQVGVQFGCSPENADSLTKSAMDVIKSIMEKGCDEKDMTKIKETFRREREVNLKENNWWLSNLVQAYTMGDKLPTQKEFDDYFNSLSSNDIKATANKYLAMNNYACFKLKPKTN